jgi:hypothetical protein
MCDSDQTGRVDRVLNEPEVIKEEANMRFLAALCLCIPVLSGCISSSNPSAPAKETTVVVPADSKPVVICSDGTHPPCN